MHVVRGAVSPDGLSWTLLEEPLLDVGKTLLDTQNIAAYDEDTGQYLAFLRGNVERRRSLRRTGGSEFGHWDDTRIVLTSDPQDPPHVDFYNSSYCRCPSSGRHLVRIHLRPAGRDSGHSPGDKPGWLELEPARAPADCRPADQHGAVQRPLRQSQPGAFRRPMGNRLPGSGSTARLG